MVDEYLWLYENEVEGGRLLMRVPRTKNRLYKKDLKIGKPVCLLTSITDQGWLWHARLGHLNFQSINHMTSSNLVRGVPKISKISKVCNSCMLGKQSRLPFP